MLSPSDKITYKDIIKKTKRQRNKLILTDIGTQVLTYLHSHFAHIINVDFTACVERDVDDIAKGTKEWVSVVRKVYESFIKEVQVQVQASLHVQGARRDASSFQTPRSLGNYKGKPVTLKSGPHGPYLLYNHTNKSLKYHLEKKELSHEDITLDDVMDALVYPYKLGTHKKHPLTIHKGPYGTYMKYKTKNYKIPQETEISLQDAISFL